MDVARTIAEYAVALRWQAIPAAARTAAATFLHDTLAVGIAGSRAPYADAVLKAAIGWSGDAGVCTILGCGLCLPPCDAAFVNAFQIHAQEFDCVHEAAVVHPLATIVAVLLAELDRGLPRSGPDVLTALIAGVDVAAGLGLAATTPIRFFRPATAGIFGSVAALASLRQVSPAVARDAIGYALSFAAGTMQAHVEGKPALPIQIAQAARSAIQAIDLAAAGLPGPQDAIEGRYGYLPMFETRFDVSRVGIGTGHRITEVSCKPFPTGRAAHGAIVATQKLMRDYGVTADRLASLVYRAPPLIHQLVGRPAKPDMSPAYARLCFAWLGSLVLTHGTVALQDFSDTRLNDPGLLGVSRRITVEVDDNPDPAAFTPATATATMHDGTRHEVIIEAQFGSPAWPLSRPEHLAKAAACLSFADMADHHERLTDCIAALPEAMDVRAAFNAVLRRPTHSGFPQ